MQRSRSTIEFQELFKQNAEENLRQSLNQLTNTVINPVEKERVSREFELFRDLFSQFLRDPKCIDWDEVKNVPEEAIIPYARTAQGPSGDCNLRSSTDNEYAKSLLNKLVVVKLNGGLGTSMGCRGPKSLISVRSGMNFLDLTVQQIETLNKKYGCDVPLVLMNSFNTEEDTQVILKKYQNAKVRVRCFNQHRFPRLNKETLQPIATTK